MLKKIYFDMDGTLYDLYNVENWERDLRAGDETVYLRGEPCVNLEALNMMCNRLKSYGWNFGILTWGAMNSTKEFFNRTAKVKRAWIEDNLPFINEIHVMQYGTLKQRRVPHGIIKNKIYLVDDNNQILEKWNGVKIKAEKLLEVLEELLEKEEKENLKNIQKTA